MVILDRDGVINHDSPNYILSVEQFQPIPASLEAIAKLNQAGIIVVVATNQSAVGRGMMTESTLQAIHTSLIQQLAVYSGWLDQIYYCPHKPEDHCACRKPQPGLIQQALQDWQISGEKTLLVGDSWRDLHAGLQAQCNTCLVKTGKGSNTFTQYADRLTGSYIANDLQDLVARML